MEINSNFDGGNITCIECLQAENIRLEINTDTHTEHLQWFYFSLSGAKQKTCTLNIENAGKASYLNGFKGYRALASYDHQYWFRVATDFDGEQLTIQHRPEQDNVYYAYFAPYPLVRHQQLIEKAKKSPLVSHLSLGVTPDGHSMDCLTLGHADKNKLPAWLIARQHPGETMAQWWMEGFIETLLDPNQPLSQQLLSRYQIYLVPNMNPDGSAKGHLRTNSIGQDLNRTWLNPSIDKSPEVFWVREKMEQTGVKFCLDVHGDEAIPYNFIAGANGIASWNDVKQKQLDEYTQQLEKINPEFQTRYGYPVAGKGKANPSLCTTFVAEHFSCLAMTLEMPFKDADNLAEPIEGWSPARCKKLAISNIEAMLHIVDYL